MTERGTPVGEVEPDSNDERQSVALAESEDSVYRCTDCHTVVLTMQDCDGGTTCHGGTMERVTESTLGIRPPDIRQVLLDRGMIIVSKPRLWDGPNVRFQCGERESIVQRRRIVRRPLDTRLSCNLAKGCLARLGRHSHVGTDSEPAMTS